MDSAGIVLSRPLPIFVGACTCVIQLTNSGALDRWCPAIGAGRDRTSSSLGKLRGGSVACAERVICKDN